MKISKQKWTKKIEKTERYASSEDFFGIEE
jgi:hypothetical protein